MEKQQSQQTPKKRYWLVGLVIFSMTLSVFAPASLLKFGLKPVAANFHYASIEGTLWSGVIRGASVNGADLGDIEFKTMVRSLVTGTLKAQLNLNGDDVFGTTELGAGLSRELSLGNADLRFNLTSLSRRYAFLGAPIEGAAAIKISTFRYALKGCREAVGEVWTDVLKGPARLFDGDAFDLVGPVSCQDGALRVELAGRGGEGSASMTIAINPDMTYLLKADAAPKRREVDEALRLMGFERGANGLTYGASGVFKGV